MRNKNGMSANMKSQKNLNVQNQPRNQLFNIHDAVENSVPPFVSSQTDQHSAHKFSAEGKQSLMTTKQKDSIPSMLFSNSHIFNNAVARSLN